MNHPKTGLLGILGYAVLAADAIRLLVEWPLVRTLLHMANLGQAIDFAVEHWQRPGWLGEPLVQLAIVAAGVGLILWDRKRPSWLPSPDVSPQKMIFGGLLIILIGVFVVGFGLWRQQNAPVIATHIQLGPAETSKNSQPEPAPPKPRKYTDYERGLKLPVINEFRDFLEGPMQKIVDDGPRLSSNWWNAIKDHKNHQSYNGDLAAFFENLNSSADRIEAIRKKNHRHEEIYAVTAPTYWNTAVSKMNVFRVNYGVASTSIKPDAPDESFYVLMNPARTSFEEGFREFVAWRNSTLSKLSELERQMTQ